MMRLKYKLLPLSLLLLTSTGALAQDVTPYKPARYTGPKVNYVRTWEAVAPTTDAGQLHTATPVSQARMTTQYVDGLGRPLQTVNKAASPTGGDLVAPVVYDEFGREVRKYLPYVAGENTGIFKGDPFESQRLFYSDQNPNSPIKGQGETFYYGKTEMEASPLNRPVKTFAPGNSWVNQGKGVETKYLINTASDSVRIWNVSDVTGGFGAYTTPGGPQGIYSAGELYKTVTIDEEGHSVVEYKDKEGKVLLKKVQLENSPVGAHTGWLCTYYLYDDLSQLRAVIQPRGVELINSTWSLNTTLLNEQCFRYEYDSRGRMVMKLVPGAPPVYMVYDGRDRLVLTQDGNLRNQNQWLFTKYDALNRPIITGLYTNTTHIGQAVMQNYLNTQNLALWENYNPSSFPLYTLNNSFPQLSGGNGEVLTFTYYDNYSFAQAHGPQFQAKDNSFDSYFAAPSNTTFPYPQPLTAVSNAIGQVTGQWQAVATGGTLLGNFYNEKGQLVQTKYFNQTAGPVGYASGLDITTYQYSFSGQLLQKVERFQKAGLNAQTLLLATRMTYDAGGRLTLVEKNINNGSWHKLSEMSYDALGQLQEKKLGVKPGTSTTELETLKNEYNIRGWLLGINKDYVSGNNSEKKFGFELAYDMITPVISNQGYVPQYNGNIAGTIWKSAGDGERRRYDFGYDNLNRLLKADFTQLAGSNFDKSAGIDFSVNMGDGVTATSAYDANGNIQRMVQKGIKGLNGQATIDSLTYSYLTASNKLQGVLEEANDKDSKLGDFKYDPDAKTGTDYSYDSNGNLVSDQNKKITSIQYNHLNLPTLITTNKGTIAYTYDAEGSKLKKVVTDNTTATPKVTTTLYLGAGVYQNDTLQFLASEEGRLRYQPASGSKGEAFYWDYFLKDHLGNVRMVLTEQRDTVKYLPATVETTTWQEEAKVYAITESRREDTPNGADTTHFQQKVYRTLGTNPQEKTGLGAVIKVMSGDRVGLMAESYYQPPVTPVENNKWLAVNELLTAFTGSDAVKGIKGVIAPGDVSALGTNPQSLQPFIQTPSGSVPVNAHLAWILFDEQMKYVAGSTDPVSTTTDGYKLHTLTVPVTKNGYLYVYVANQSNQVVYFDNLALTHYKGPILEETHYYPFGLTMHGISSKAVGGMENKKKYNGIELESDLELQTYDAFFRELDPQTGRWWQIDPVTEGYEHLSPYASMYNNPITYSDPLGNEGDGCCNLGWSIVGGAAALLDNMTGINLRLELAPSSKNPEAVKAYNRGQDGGDVASMIIGSSETVAGGGLMFGGGALALSGVGAPVGGGTTAAGGLMAAHGIFTSTNGANNLINQNGRVQASSNSNSSNVPNPNGKNGGKPHQDKISAAENKLQSKGYETQREVKMSAPASSTKNNRFVDIAATKDGKVIYVNVGKQNQSGTPVSRERKALDDIKQSPDRAPDSKVIFIPYNKK